MAQHSLGPPPEDIRCKGTHHRAGSKLPAINIANGRRFEIIINLNGKGGSGKSALAEWIAEQARSQPWRRLHGPQNDVRAGNRRSAVGEARPFGKASAEGAAIIDVGAAEEEALVRLIRDRGALTNRRA